MDALQATVENFNRKTRIDFSGYRFLVATMSRTYQSVVCFCQAMKPEKIFLIVSEDTVAAVDEFYIAVNRYCTLGMSSIMWKPFNASNPAAIYKEVLAFCEGKNPREILFDGTAGKKPMSAAAVLAAEMLHSDVAYSDYAVYDWKKGRPEPGTEYGRLLEMPYAIFGDLEIKKALNYMQGYHFSGAIAVLQQLEQRLENVGVVRNLLCLSRALQDWDGFRFQSAMDQFRKVEPYGNLSAQMLSELRKILEILCYDNHEEYPACELANFYFTGIRYAQNEKYDLGVFMMYRVAERNGQLRLAELGIDASDIREDLISDEVFDSYREYKKQIFGPKARVEITKPSRVGCLEAYILLHVLEHPAYNPKKGVKFCNNLQNIASKRNQSIYVHGSSPMGKADFEEFERFSRGQLYRYLAQKSSRTFEEFERVLTYPWLNGESKN